MERQLDRLERLSALAANNTVINEIRDELINEMYRAGVSVADLVKLTGGLTRARIYQLLEETS
jgi:hypothetical protein